jgi:Fe-S oxidoreductase
MAWVFFLFISYYLLFIVIGSGLGLSETMENSSFFAFYSWAMDIVAPFAIVGVLWAIIRRYIIKPKRLEGQQTVEAMVILVTVLIHPISHLFKIGTAIAQNHPPASLGIATPPISTALSGLFSPESVNMWHSFWFWLHWGFVLFVLVYIGYSRYLHIIAAPLNDLLRPEFPRGTPDPINLKEPVTFGASRIKDFTRKQLLDLYSCVDVGYCHEACPATATGKPLNPRLVIQSLKANLLKNGPLILDKREPIIPLIGEGEDSVSEEAIWECTTCGACMEVCPVYIEHVHEIIDLRRNLIQLQAKFPDELLKYFENMEQKSNPWGIAPAERNKWITKTKAKPFEAGETEYLLYVSCAGALDARNKQTTMALATILDTSGISWGILGKDEMCCGDSLRRLGNEYAFKQMAKNNIDLFQDRGIKKVITQCPHCYHTLKHDYRQYGIELDVIHHTELINILINKGALKLKSPVDMGKVIFHDSCYLGRYNMIYEAPRQVILSVTGQKSTEMERHHNRSFCCGGGGGQMWMDENIGKSIKVARIEESLEKAPDTICVCCPYCMTMFEDGLKNKDADDRVKVLDLAEVVVKALCRPNA